MEFVTVARRGHPYPSVRVLAADLVNRRVAPVAPGARVEDALALAVRVDAAAVAMGGRTARVALREDLHRAASLGFGEWVAWRLARPLPVVEANASEIAVGRHRRRGAPLVLVRDGNALVGAIGRGSLDAHPGPSLASRLLPILAPSGCSRLARVGALAELNGGRAYAVGGVVRDALRGGPRDGLRDLDVVVEGDGRAVARLLAAEVGGTLVEHDRFLTASVRDGAGPRVDIATARAERYAVPGALPQVRPAGIEEDLRRRDFTVNAMAAELSSGAFLLIDPLGGRDDLQRRRLRVLHPLSFVEDPTRILRAARYEARLGLKCDRWTAACRELALEHAPYPALSGSRLVAELELVLAEPGAGAAVSAALGAAGAFRLLDRDCRYTPMTAGWVRDLAEARAWAHAHRPPTAEVELLLLVLLGDQPREVAHRALDRLGIEGERRQRLLRSLETGATVREALRAANAASARARLLRGASALERVWLWLGADAETRATITRTVDREAAAEPWLSGDELVALGVARGPRVGQLLEELRDGRLDHTIPDRVAAEAHVRRWAGRSDVNGRPGGSPGGEG
jgi:tRNA nucleotidyltransferase (CCA-adding enzyme)